MATKDIVPGSSEENLCRHDKEHLQIQTTQDNNMNGWLPAICMLFIVYIVAGFFLLYNLSVDSWYLHL